jgi:GAF domain-containing protein
MAEPADQTAVPETLLLLAEEIVLDLPAVDHLLQDAARSAAANIGLSCGITYLARYGVVTVASSDERARAVDEIQYGVGAGPCLEALRTGAVVRVDDLATDERWGSYRDQALHAGVRSSVSFPLTVAGRSVGALNVYSAAVGPMPADQEAAAMLISSQVGGVLQAVRSLAATMLRDDEAVTTFQQRHELDIATGMIMSEHGCTDAAARVLLHEQAAAQDVPLATVVARMLGTAALAQDPAPPAGSDGP